MKQLTNFFKTTIAKQFYDSLTANTSSYYIGVANSSELVSTANTVASIADMVHELDKEILYGNKVVSSDVSMTIRTNAWVSGTIYSMYDDAVANNDNFYVVVDESDNTKSVFKCLKNKKTFVGGTSVIAPSVIKPSKFYINPTDKLFKTSDGYIWKFMYNLDTSEISKFCSATFTAVKQDTAVGSAAVSGAIEVVDVVLPGSNYNKYAYASISQASIGGNPSKYKITPTEFSNIYEFNLSGANTFTLNSSVDIISASTVIGTGTVYGVSGNILKVISTFNQNLGTYLPVKIKQGVVEETFTSFVKTSVPNISLEANAYLGHGVYVRSGTGAGQYNIIADYTVAANQFLITFQSPFTLTLDSTSKIEILPAVTFIGDGLGAIAIPRIDSQTNSIIDIEVINKGTNYTYASATITGNNVYIDYAGQSSLPSTASLNPIISPIGGHGYDAFNELMSDGVCIHTVLDSTTPQTNSYKKIVLFDKATLNSANTHFNDIISTAVSINYLGINNSGFQVGERVSQGNSSGLVFAANTSVIQLTDIHSTFAANSTPMIGGTTGSIATINTISTTNRIKSKLHPLYIEDLQNAINRDVTDDVIKLNIQF